MDTYAAQPLGQLPQAVTPSQRVTFFVLLVVANLALAFIRPHEYMPFLQGFPIIPIALITCFLGWVATRKNLDGPMGNLVLMFLIITTMSLFVAGHNRYGVAWFINFVLTCLMFYYVTASSSSIKRVRLLMWVFVASGIVMVIHSIQQSIDGIGWTGEVPIEGRVRYIGMLNDPNDMGLFLVMGLPFLVLFLSQTRNPIKKLFWLAVIGSYFYTFYLTQSRGTLVASAAIMLLMVARRFGKIIAGGLIFGLLSGVAILPERMTQISAEEESAYTRVEAWFSGLQMFESNVLTGVGAGRFTDFHHRTAHNTLLLVIAETGLFGVTVFIAMFGYAFLMMREAAFKRKPPEADQPDPEYEQQVAIARALYYSLIGFMAAGFFLSRSYVVFPYILLGMISGYYAYLRRQDPDLPEFRFSADFIKWGVLSVVVILALYVMVRVLL